MPNEPHLFVYGTLLCDEVFHTVTGVRCPSCPATLHGFRRGTLRDASYPGIAPDPAHAVVGALYRNVPDECWPALDVFEGDEYQRQRVTVTLSSGESVPAWTYVIALGHVHRLAAADWDYAAFLHQWRIGGGRAGQPDLFIA